MTNKLITNKQLFWDLETSGAGKKEHSKAFSSTPKWEQILQSDGDPDPANFLLPATIQSSSPKSNQLLSQACFCL